MVYKILSPTSLKINPFSLYFKICIIFILIKIITLIRCDFYIPLTSLTTVYYKELSIKL